jgi:hypothetical protein
MAHSNLLRKIDGLSKKDKWIHFLSLFLHFGHSKIVFAKSRHTFAA